MINSIVRPRVVNWHCVENFIQELERSVEMHFDPTRSLFDALTRIVRSPTLDERQSQNAEPTQVVDTDSSGRRQT